jgi:hypothetical protein
VKRWFSIVDEHVHVAVTASAARSGHLARTILLALRPYAAARLDPAHLRPVETRRHLEWLVQYILDQPRRHDLPVHPALWSGSCFADLVGARLVPGLKIHIRQVLPRFRLRTAFEAVGLVAARLVPSPDEEVRRVGASVLTETAAAALCVVHPLRGKTARTTLARAACCQIARTAGIANAEVAHALDITRQGVSQLAGRTIDRRILRVVRMRLALRQRVMGCS